MSTENNHTCMHKLGIQDIRSISFKTSLCYFTAVCLRIPLLNYCCFGKQQKQRIKQKIHFIVLLLVLRNVLSYESVAFPNLARTCSFSPFVSTPATSLAYVHHPLIKLYIQSKYKLRNVDNNLMQNYFHSSRKGQCLHVHIRYLKARLNRRFLSEQLNAIFFPARLRF